MSWAAKEFGTLDLGDARLNRRAVLLAERLAQKPGASFPNACQNWSETVAAYRFLSNEDVNWDDVMQAHWQASEQRIGQHPVVLCLQDTTELDFNAQQMAGLGPLSYEAQRGLYLHPTYVVTPDRELLGVTNAWTWAREFKAADGTRPGALESMRWIESYERVAEQARHVCVCDRESDIMALLVRARELNHAADYLVRSQHNRAVDGCQFPRKSGGGKWWRNLVAQPGVHFWWWIPAAAFGAGCTNDKGPVRGPCRWRWRFVGAQNGKSGSKSSSDSLLTALTRCSRSSSCTARP